MRAPRARRRAALVLLLLAVAAAGCRVEEEPAAGQGAKPAPLFTLARLEGEPLALASLRGRPVVIDFWATWCAPCIRQVPVLNAVQEAWGDDVAVIGISVDTEGRRVVAEFAEEHGIRYPVLLGSFRLAQRYGAFGFPTTYVVAPDGTVAFAHAGVVTKKQLDAALRRVSGP